MGGNNIFVFKSAGVPRASAFPFFSGGKQTPLLAARPFAWRKFKFSRGPVPISAGKVGRARSLRRGQQPGQRVPRARRPGTNGEKLERKKPTQNQKQKNHSVHPGQTTGKTREGLKHGGITLALALPTSKKRGTMGWWGVNFLGGGGD